PEAPRRRFEGLVDFIDAHRNAYGGRTARDPRMDGAANYWNDFRNDKPAASATGLSVSLVAGASCRRNLPELSCPVWQSPNPIPYRTGAERIAAAPQAVASCPGQT